MLLSVGNWGLSLVCGLRQGTLPLWRKWQPFPGTSDVVGKPWGIAVGSADRFGRAWHFFALRNCVL